MKFLRKYLTILGLAFMPLFMNPTVSYANIAEDVGGSEVGLSNDGAEFKGIYDTLKGWLEGYLGKTLIIVFFIIGIFFAIAKRDLMSTFGAFGLAFIVSIAPNVLDLMMSGGLD